MAQHPAQTIGNRRAKAQPLLGLGAVAIQALKLFEDQLQLVLRNTRPLIPHLDAHRVGQMPHAQYHARGAGVTEGIGEEVLQHTAQQAHVAAHPQPAAVDAQVNAVLHRQCAELDTQGVEQFAQGKVAQLRHNAPRFQTGDVQQIGDQLLGRGQ